MSNMTARQVAKAHNGLLTADVPARTIVTKVSASNHPRSLSCATSTRSRASRVTLVENDADFTAYNPSKIDEDEHVMHHTRPQTWVDRIFGVFCAKRKEPSMKKSGKSETREWSELSNDTLTWPSPWILPVYVVAKELDEDKHPKAKITKCTIDTGNLQGNIVSRSFVATLGYLESDFEELTKDEARGGTGITGDEHLPLGAIYLTWYHKNSPRVFRDMRFLVSPTEHFDMIIGARSIHKDKILTVPCLMGDRNYLKDPAPEDPTVKELRKLISAYETQFSEKDTRIQELENDKSGNKSTKELNKLRPKREELKNIKSFFELMKTIYSPNEGGNTEAAVDKWKDIKHLWLHIKLTGSAEAVVKGSGATLKDETKTKTKDSIEIRIRKELDNHGGKENLWQGFWEELEKDERIVSTVPPAK